MVYVYSAYVLNHLLCSLLPLTQISDPSLYTMELFSDAQHTVTSTSPTLTPTMVSLSPSPSTTSVHSGFSVFPREHITSVTPPMPSYRTTDLPPPMIHPGPYTRSSYVELDSSRFSGASMVSMPDLYAGDDSDAGGAGAGTGAPMGFNTINSIAQDVSEHTDGIDTFSSTCTSSAAISSTTVYPPTSQRDLTSTHQLPHWAMRHQRSSPHGAATPTHHHTMAECQVSSIFRLFNYLLL